MLARPGIGVKAASAPLGGWQHGAVGVLAPFRLVAAHVQRGPPSGIVFVSAYLHTSVGPEDEGNIGLFRCLATYLAEIGQQGFDGITIGDWNLTPDEMPQRWISRVGGVIVAPTEPTCCTTLPGRARPA